MNNINDTSSSYNDTSNTGFNLDEIYKILNINSNPSLNITITLSNDTKAFIKEMIYIFFKSDIYRDNKKNDE